MWTIDNGGYLSTSSIFIFAVIVIFAVCLAISQTKNYQQKQLDSYDRSNSQQSY